MSISTDLCTVTVLDCSTHPYPIAQAPLMASTKDFEILLFSIGNFVTTNDVDFHVVIMGCDSIIAIEYFSYPDTMVVSHQFSIEKLVHQTSSMYEIR